MGVGVSCYPSAMSRFEIDRATLRARLSSVELSAASRAVLLYYVDKSMRESDVGLWIDEPWLDLEFDELATDATVGRIAIINGVALALTAQ